jgi:hypothetical protein
LTTILQGKRERERFVILEINRDKYEIFVKDVKLASPLSDTQKSSPSFSSLARMFVKICQLPKEKTIEEVQPLLPVGWDFVAQVSASTKLKCHYLGFILQK